MGRMKYKNKGGISLNFTGIDSLSVLVREVVSESIIMLEDVPGQDLQSLSGISDTIDFLKENFNIEDENKNG